MHTTLGKRGIRFALAGAAVALLYLLVTTGLHDALSVPFQVALLCGFATAVPHTLRCKGPLSGRTRPATRCPPIIRQAATSPSLHFKYSATAAATALLPGPLGIGVTFIPPNLVIGLTLERL